MQELVEKLRTVDKEIMGVNEVIADLDWLVTACFLKYSSDTI